MSILEGNLEEATRDHILYLSGANKLAIKKGEWKYIDCLGSGGFTRPYEMKPVKNGPQGQLYHLTADPMKLENLYLEKPGKAKEMKRLLEQYRKKGYSRPQ